MLDEVREPSLTVVNQNSEQNIQAEVVETLNIPQNLEEESVNNE